MANSFPPLHSSSFFAWPTNMSLSLFTLADGAGPHCGSTCISSPAANRGAHSRTPVWNPDLDSTAGDTKAIAEKAAISRANQHQALRSRARSLESRWAPQENMHAIIENAGRPIGTNPKNGRHPKCAQKG